MWLLKEKKQRRMGGLDGIVFIGCSKFMLVIYRPVRPTAVLKDDGVLTQGPEEVLDHWYISNFVECSKFA